MRMSHYNLHSENSYGSASRFKSAKSLDDGVASVWGGATTISSDSGAELVTVFLEIDMFISYVYCVGK